MKRFIVTERITLIVVHHNVEADNEAQARDLVIALGADEYDELIDVADSTIITVKEAAK